MTIPVLPATLLRLIQAVPEPLMVTVWELLYFLILWFFADFEGETSSNSDESAVSFFVPVLDVFFIVTPLFKTIVTFEGT